MSRRREQLASRLSGRATNKRVSGETATTKGKRTEKIGIMKQKWPMWRLYRNKPGVAQPFYVTTTKGTFKKSFAAIIFAIIIYFPTNQS